jgi:outer membrane protein assembly factor BamB
MNSIDHDSLDDDAKIEITDLDSTTHSRTLHELHFTPRARLWMIVVTCVSVALFLSFTFGSQFYSLVYKPPLPKIALSTAPSAIELRGVTNGVVYAFDPEHMVYAIRASNGSLLWQSFYPNINQSTSSNGVTYTITASGKISATRENNSLLWSYQLPSSLILSLAAADHYVYVTTSDGTIYALDAAKGSLLWQYQLNIQVTPQILASGGFVYVNSYSGTLYTFLAKNGKLLWQRQLPIAAQVLVTNQSIIYASDSNVTVLHSNNGSLAWHLHLAATPVQPLAMTHGNIYVATFDNNVAAFNASNGAFLWRRHLPALAYEPIVAMDTTIYIHGSNYAIYTLNAVTGTPLWSKPATNIFTFVVVQGTTYIVTVNSEVGALGANGISLWQRQLPSRVMPPLIVSRGAVYTGTISGTVYALRASDSTLLWHYATQIQ